MSQTFLEMLFLRVAEGSLSQSQAYALANDRKEELFEAIPEYFGEEEEEG